MNYYKVVYSKDGVQSAVRFKVRCDVIGAIQFFGYRHSISAGACIDSVHVISESQYYACVSESLTPDSYRWAVYRDLGTHMASYDYIAPDFLALADLLSHVQSDYPVFKVVRMELQD